MEAQRSRGNRVARGLGVVIFVIGVVLLGVVFALAAVTFSQLPRLLANSQAGVQGLGMMLLTAAVRAIFLLVMAYVSSLLASKGLELYAAARPEGGS